jgi:hypothetical protein
MLDPTTRETPDGGAEPLPNHPDFGKKGEVASQAAAPSTDAPADAEAPSEAAPAKRKRRTKAEMEAARAAEAAAASALSTAPTVTAEPRVYLGHGGQSGEVRPHVEPTEAEFERELAAAAAESEGHAILTDETRTLIESEAVAYYLRNLSLEGAIALVRERMFSGMKTVEVER